MIFTQQTNSTSRQLYADESVGPTCCFVVSVRNILACETCSKSSFPNSTLARDEDLIMNCVHSFMWGHHWRLQKACEISFKSTTNVSLVSLYVDVLLFFVAEYRLLTVNETAQPTAVVSLSYCVALSQTRPLRPLSF